jgi:hypothetical protein
MRSIRPVAVVGLLLVVLSGCAGATTDEVGNVGGTYAQVYGTVASSAGGAVEYWAEYGRTTGYGSATDHSVEQRSTNHPFGVLIRIEGLARSTTYHFRVCARDSQQQGGPGCGADRTFTTINVDCGEVITRDLVLSGSLHCPYPDGFFKPGLIVGADGVDIDLNGHELVGALPPSLHPEGEPGIVNDGYDDVTVHGGTVTQWGFGLVFSDVNFNRLHDLRVRAWAGITLSGGEGNTVRRYHLIGIGRGGSALGASGDHMIIADSTGQKFFVSGNHIQVLRNRISGIFEPSPSLGIAGNDIRVADNMVSGDPGGGIVVFSGSGNALIRNDVLGGVDAPDYDYDEPDGIRVEPFTAGTLIRDNVTHEAGDDGIDVQATDARLKGNRSDGNGDFGIDAVGGVTDGGGNTASGNGNPLQCRNVFCQ